MLIIPVSDSALARTTSGSMFKRESICAESSPSSLTVPRTSETLRTVPRSSTSACISSRSESPPAIISISSGVAKATRSVSSCATPARDIAAARSSRPISLNATRVPGMRLMSASTCPRVTFTSVSPIRALSSPTRPCNSSAAPTARPSTPSPVSAKSAGSTDRSTDAPPFSPARSRWIPTVSTTSIPDNSNSTIPSPCGIDSVSGSASASAVVSSTNEVPVVDVFPARSVTVTETFRSPSERPLTSMSSTTKPPSVALTTATTEEPSLSPTVTETATISSSRPSRATVTSPDSASPVRMSNRSTSTESSGPSISADGSSPGAITIEPVSSSVSYCAWLMIPSTIIS